MAEKAPGWRAALEAVRLRIDVAAREPRGSDTGLADFVARVRAYGLRVTARTVPVLHEAAERVRTALHLDIPLELYVRNDPSADAFAPLVAADLRPVVVVNSGLVTLLEPNELDFALGHELGHLALHAGRWPAGRIPESELEDLQRSSRSQYAELSADRVGLLACRSVFLAARVLVKLASGLTGSMIGLDVDAFVRQMDRDPAELSRSWEVRCDHPSLPLRLWALLRFGASDLYADLAGQGGSGTPLAVVEESVEAQLADLGDGRLSSLEERTFTLALRWAAAAMVFDDDVVRPVQRGGLRALLGEAAAEEVVAYAAEHGRAAVHGELGEALAQLAKTNEGTRRRFRETIEAFASSFGISLADTSAGRAIQATVA